MWLKLIVIAAVGLVILGLWIDVQAKKTQIASLEAQLGVCQKDVEQFKGEVDSLSGMIEKLKDNLASIKRQMAQWKEIAKEADNYAKRLLAAAESKTSCEVYNAENAKIAIDITNAFNNSVRGKVHRSDSSTGGGAAPAILPQAGSPGANEPSVGGGQNSNANPAR